MIRRFLILTLVIVCFYNKLVAQEYSYTHYDIQDGLAGAVVYNMSQDKDGFLWFSTETGLSRFDGTRFVTFTTADGLTDNEILGTFPDSKGRVWIAPFSAAICYYYQGKIYTQQNDSVLKKIRLNSFILDFAEDSLGNIAFIEPGKLHVLKPNGELTGVSSRPIHDSIVGFLHLESAGKGKFVVLDSYDTYLYDLKNLIHKTTIPNTSYPPFYGATSLSSTILVYRGAYLKNEYVIERLDGKKEIVPFPGIGLSRIQHIRDSVIVFSSSKGAFFYRPFSDEQHRIFLPGNNVTSTLRDREGNWWFSTYGQGVYKLNSEYIRNMQFPMEGQRMDGITAISEVQQKILLGSESQKLYFLSLKNNKVEYTRWEPPLSESSDRIIDFKIYPDGRFLYGTGSMLHLNSTEPKLLRYRPGITVKKIASDAMPGILIANARSLIRINPEDLSTIDTIYRGRTTTVFDDAGVLYIGKIDGLYRSVKKDSLEYLGARFPILKNRVTALQETTDGTLWIATFGMGLVAFKNDSVVRIFNNKTGLVSNICKTIFAKNNDLWIGTDNGVNKISTTDTGYLVKKYTVADGLLSNNINSIFVNDSLVFIGSAKGLTYFNEKFIAAQSRCDLRLTALLVSNESYSTDIRSLALPNYKNNIRFEYVGISFRSVGDIIYRYRLLGLDSNWQTTREHALSYPTLPSGEYELQLEAINKFGVNSEMLQFKFVIEKLIWQKNWFRLLLSVVLILMIILFVSYVVKRIKKREEEKTRLNARMTEMEQLALKSQMNPHFIFNSLNSIQQYVMDKDIAGANKFITGFSRLIRQTLDFSSRALVPISDEINYIQTYLDLEKNRLEGKFDYHIRVEEELKENVYSVPPMIIQPYVENAIRHGIRYRRDKEGRIDISFSKAEGFVVCIIEDNGIGRKQSAYYKTANPIEYQSKGMSLTANRIDLINKNLSEKMSVLIEDLVNQDMEALGTRVTIKFPEDLH